MDNSETLANPTLRAAALKLPLIPARLLKPGTMMRRVQPLGQHVLFTVVTVRSSYPVLESDWEVAWYREEKRWVPFERIVQDQLTIHEEI